GRSKYKNLGCGSAVSRSAFSIAPRLLARVRTVTSWRRASCVAHCQPTCGSEPLPGSHAYAERRIFIGKNREQPGLFQDLRKAAGHEWRKANSRELVRARDRQSLRAARKC